MILKQGLFCLPFAPWNIQQYLQIFVVLSQEWDAPGILWVKAMDPATFPVMSRPPTAVNQQTPKVSSAKAGHPWQRMF